MDLTYREITESDLLYILKIYNYYIVNTTVTFHKDPINIDDARRIHPINHNKYKTYIVEKNNMPVGYCSYGQFKNKEAYDRTAEVSIYLDKEFLNSGIGRIALRFIEEIAKDNKVFIFLASITAENQTSINFFKKCAYYEAGYYKSIGEKFNRILDVAIYQKEL